MSNRDAIKVVYVVIDDDTQQRRGLYIDGDLQSTGVEGSRSAMQASLDGGWSGVYEQVVLRGMYAYEFCEDYSDMPDTLDEVLLCGGVESGACVFPGELD